VDRDGNCLLQTGASIVRDSVPEKECQEIKAKAAGLLRAMTSGETSMPELDRHVDARVQRVLESRNTMLSRFWLQKQSDRPTDTRLKGKSILIIDNEDEFTFMLRHILERLGMRATVKNYDDRDLDLAGADLVLVGPGPGDPGNLADPKMRAVHGIVDKLLGAGRSFLAVCLGHQILCLRLGLRTVKVDPPLQGTQKAIELFGRTEPCGFYNTFFAVKGPGLPPGVEVATDDQGHITALRAPRFASFQFHIESVLTTNGVQILQETLHRLMG
jgi:phenazine biosynthesis protein phzE